MERSASAVMVSDGLIVPVLPGTAAPRSEERGASPRHGSQGSELEQAASRDLHTGGIGLAAPPGSPSARNTSWVVSRCSASFPSLS